MNLKDATLAGVAGTTAFTTFSYLAADIFNKKFKEPELLGTMIDRVTPALDKKESQFSGWMLHYITGIGFAAACQYILEQTDTKPNIQKGVVAGLLSALPGSLMWHTAFKIHPAPPRKESLAYYTQLTIGHAIFGAVSFAMLRYLKNIKQQRDLHPQLRASGNAEIVG